MMHSTFHSRSRIGGFSLIELLSVIVIIAVLAAIAIPNYNRHVRKGRRTDAQNILMRIAAEQERFYTLFNRYTATLGGTPPTGLGVTSLTSEHGYYTVAGVVDGTAQTFTLTATPVGVQTQDECANLTLSSADAKGFSGNDSNGNCW